MIKFEVSLYGLNQASFNWYYKLNKSLEDRRYVASDIYPYLHLGNSMIVLNYVYDCISDGNNTKDIDSLIYSSENGPDKFALTDEGDIEKFLGIKIIQLNRKHFKESQPFLINHIISFIGFDPE